MRQWTLCLLYAVEFTPRQIDTQLRHMATLMPALDDAQRALDEAKDAAGEARGFLDQVRELQPDAPEETFAALDAALQEREQTVKASQQALERAQVPLPLVTDLVRGVLAHRDELDELIQRSSRRWRVRRMAHIDRNILRLASYELMHRTDVPPRVVINEAVELAKRFGAEQTRSFVNGILQQVCSDNHIVMEPRRAPRR